MSISTWTNQVLPRISGASKEFVESEIVRTINHFCRESTCWRQMVFGLHIELGNREVPVVIGSGEDLKVIQIFRVYYQRRQVTPYSHTPWEVTSNSPIGWSGKPSDPSTILLSAVPNQQITDALDVWVAVAPKDPVNLDSAEMSILEETFWEPIFDGILGRLYSQPNKPYTDDTLARYHLARLRDGIRRGRDNANRGFTGNAQNWTFPNFGR